MKFHLVVCPHCLKPRVVENRGQKSSSCQLCGAKDKLHTLKVLKASDDLQEVIAERGALGAQLAGKGRDYIEKLLASFQEAVVEEAQAATRKVTSDRDTVQAVVEELSREMGEAGFTYGEFALRLREKKSNMNPKNWIGVLQEEAMVYKGQDGKFRKV